MRDLKSQKAVRTKGNRRKSKKQARDWKKIFHRTLRISICTGSVALVASGGALLARLLSDADFFRIDTLSVAKQQRVSREEILSLSDIRLGMSIFDLDLELIGRKIEENPWIATASVARVFPREVSISVTERVPRAVVSLGYLYYADESGDIFKLLEPDDRLDYPLVTGLDRRYLLDHPQEARRLLKEAMGLLKNLSTRERFNLDDVSELHIDQTDGFELYTYVGGVPIRMGNGNFIGKLDRLERIYRDLEPRLLALKQIDLNVADRVIVKLEGRGAHEKG
jgi:cell division protein FtsQ